MPPDRPVAVVSGGNRGIGLEVVRQLGHEGFATVLGSRDPGRGEAAAGGLRREGLEPIVMALDVADDESVAALAARVRDEFERCDVLVNNAAIHYDIGQRGASADLAIVREAFETNVLGAWRLVEALLGLLRRAPHGRIVNVSSQGGSLASMGGGTPAYSVSKAALNAMTRVLAGELDAGGILVNAVCPGWTATDMGGAGGRPVGQGAASVVWAALLPDDGPTGGFFRDGRALPW